MLDIRMICSGKKVRIWYKGATPKRYRMVNVDRRRQRYTSFIYDTVDAVFQGEEAYVFSLKQVKDVVKFLRDINVRYVDGIYYINRR